MTIRQLDNPIARAKAVEVLRGLRIESADEIDVEAIAFHHGLRVRDGGLRGARGRLVAAGSTGLIRVSDDVVDAVAQRRFVIAHELGHHLLHVARGKTSVCTGDDFVRYGDTTPETEANRFAAELLMPKRFFEPRCDVRRPALAHVDELAALFQTTLTAATIRFVDLCPEACAVVWSERGKIVWAVRGKDFYGWIERGAALDSGTHAYDAFAGKGVPDRPQLVDAHAWASRTRGDMYEHTRWFGRLGATLTLLWAPG